MSRREDRTWRVISGFAVVAALLLAAALMAL
jgi:hypothetical protein